MANTGSTSFRDIHFYYPLHSIESLSNDFFGLAQSSVIRTIVAITAATKLTPRRRQGYEAFTNPSATRQNQMSLVKYEH